MFRSRQTRDLIKVNYTGELPTIVSDFLANTAESPEVLDHKPLVLSVTRDHDFIDKLLSVLKKASIDEFRVQGVELRRLA